MYLFMNYFHHTIKKIYLLFKFILFSPSHQAFDMAETFVINMHHNSDQGSYLIIHIPIPSLTAIYLSSLHFELPLTLMQDLFQLTSL